MVGWSRLGSQKFHNAHLGTFAQKSLETPALQPSELVLCMKVFCKE